MDAERIGSSASVGPGQVLILGDSGALSDALAHRLGLVGAEVVTMVGGRDSEVTARLYERNWAAVAVLSHDDALALRLTLLSAHIRPEVPLWVTLFDRTTVNRVRQLAPSVNVVETAALVAGQLAEHCLEFVGKRRTGPRIGFRIVDDALRLMVVAGAGLLAILAMQIAITVLALHDGLVDAIYFSTRSVATVADVPLSETAPDWFKLVSTATTIVAVVLVAIFTAAMVRRLSRPSLTTLVGSRRPASRGHVLLVGFGQIGMRLAQALQARSVPVIALERDIDAPCIRLARKAGIPVAIGRGDDRAMLELLGVSRCAVVAAVTSDDLANVAIGLAASDLRPGVPLVLRLGDGDVATETDSLLHLGRIFDAHELVARMLADAIMSDTAAESAKE